MPGQPNLPAKGFEQPSDEALAASAGKNRDSDPKRQLAIDELGPIRAAPPEGRAQDLGDGDAQEGRRDPGPVVDVLVEGGTLSPLPPSGEAHRVDVKHQDRGAAILGGLGV